MPFFYDIETYYDSDYTLKKLPTWVYLHDPRFELLGVSWAVDDEPVNWVDASGLDQFFVAYDTYMKQAGFLVSHNTMFDGGWLKVHHQRDAVRYGDTLAMARVVIGDALEKLDLSACCDYFGVATKQGAEILDSTKGKHWAQFTEQEKDAMAAYCIADTEACRALYYVLAKHTPESQDWHIDWAIRTFFNPVLRLDTEILRKASEDRHRLESLIESVSGVPIATLRSRNKFAALMDHLGFPVPYKTSKTTGQLIPALSKTDFEFAQYSAELQAIPDLDAGIKQLPRLFQVAMSNTTHTRARKYLQVAKMTPEQLWPVHLNHSGAKQTHRMSGGAGGGGNPQNLVRGGLLRKAIYAPPGYVVIAPDLNAVELRISMQLCNVTSVLAVFSRQGDPYSDYVARQANISVSEVSPDMRMLGKVKMLALQYAVGWKTYGLQAWVRTGNPITREQAELDVAYYRREFWQVKAMWKTLEVVLQSMVNAAPIQIPGAPFLRVSSNVYTCARTGQRKVDGAIALPSGLLLKYRDIKKSKRGFSCESRKPELKRANYRKNLYGGHLLENIAQAIAGEVVREKRIMLAGALYTPVLEVHDELVGVVPKIDAPEIAKRVEKLLSEPVAWWPELGIKAEAAYGDTYGDAK